MDWYKHSTGSHDDPDVYDAMDEFGHTGYSVFFITLEIYGSEYNHLDSEGWLTISKRFLARKLRLSQAKVEQILNFYSERQRIITKTHQNTISIKCPKFVDIASNWTKRKNHTPTEGLQRSYVAPHAIEEEEEEKKKKKKQYTDDFLIFYDAYPNKKDKDAAWKAWRKRNGSMPEISILLSAIEAQVEWRNKANGSFRPHWKNPATWINSGSWMDVLDNNDGGSNDEDLDKWAMK